MKEFYKYTEQINELIKTEKPTEQDLKKLLGIIGDDNDLAIYFYRENTNGEWATLLNEAGEFNDLASQENVNQPLPRMKAHYLVEAAKQKPKEVVALISKIDVKDITIQGIFLKALLKKPLSVVEEGENIIKKYFEVRDRYTDWYMVGVSSAEFMTAIAEKYPDKAFEIAGVLLEIWKPEKKERFLDDTKTRFKEDDYEDLVFKHYKNLWELNSFRSAKLLIDIFNRYLEELPEDDYSLVKGFNVRIERLDKIRERFHREVVKIIVQGICEAGKAVIEKQPEKIDELLDYLESLKKVIFERIDLYLLRSVPAGTQKGRINSMISNKRFLDNSYWWYEYRLLLRDKFEDVSDEAKKAFIDWVDGLKIDKEEKESINSWYEEYKDRAEKPDFEKIINHRKAQQLFLVRQKFPKLYEKYQSKSGSSDEEIEPKPRIGEVRAISGMEGSPLDVGEMLKMEPPVVIEYILDPSKWVGDKTDAPPFHSPEEALAATFGKVVQQRVEDYIDLNINELMKLKPEFLRNYAIGIRDASNEKNIKDTDMPKVLNQLHYVVGEKKDDLEYQGYISNMLYFIGQLFDDKSLKKKIIKTNLNVIWEIIKALISYNDGGEITEETYKKPHSACINCVPGRAFEFIIRFGLICKNADKKDYKKSWSSKIQAVLKNVINEVKDPRIRSALGVWFPQLHWLEEELIIENIDKIFDHSDDKEWNVTWGSYIKWARAYKNTFLAVQGKYESAIEKIRSESKGEEYDEPERGLVEHLIVAYYNGWISWDCRLLNKFFEEAPAKLRGKAAGFMKTGFKTTKEQEEEYKNAVKERVRIYWEKRLEVIEKEPAENFNEAVGFLGWVKDTLLEPKETLELTLKTLELTNGKLGENRNENTLVKGVCQIGEGNELLALKCINKIMQGKPEWLVFSLYKGDLEKFLEHIIGLSNDTTNIMEIREEAIRLINAYGRRQIDELRPYYDKLSKIHP